MARTEWKTDVIGTGGIEEHLNAHEKEGYRLFGIYPTTPTGGAGTFLLVWSKSMSEPIPVTRHQ